MESKFDPGEVYSVFEENKTHEKALVGLNKIADELACEVTYCVDDILKQAEKEKDTDLVEEIHQNYDAFVQRLAVQAIQAAIKRREA